MSTLPQVNPQQAAATHFQEIQKLFPQMPEPHRGAMTYAINVSISPSIDVHCCQAAGKVVHIVAKMTGRVENPVTIRGSLHSVLDWNTDHAAISQGSTLDYHSREFVFHVPVAQMNETFEFKFCEQVGASLPHRWSMGNNCTVDLSKYGHLVQIEVTNLSFA